MFHGLARGLTFLKTTITLLTRRGVFKICRVGQLLCCWSFCYIILSFSRQWIMHQAWLASVWVLAPERNHTAAAVCPVLHSELQPCSQPELIIGAKSQQSLHQHDVSHGSQLGNIIYIYVMFYVATLLSFCLCSICVLIQLLTYFSYEIWISNLSCSNKHAFISPFIAITLLQDEVVILLAE